MSLELKDVEIRVDGDRGFFKVGEGETAHYHVPNDKKLWDKVLDSNSDHQTDIMYQGIPMNFCVPDKNDYVFFKGVLTAKEFSELVPKKIDKDSLFSLEVDFFKGGINRFFTFIQVLNPEFIKSLQEDKKLSPLLNLRKKATFITAGLTAGVAILLGSNLSPTPRLASIQSQQVAMFSTLRGNQGEAVKNICLVILFFIFKNSKFSKIWGIWGAILADVLRFSEKKSENLQKSAKIGRKNRKILKKEPSLGL